MEYEFSYEELNSHTEHLLTPLKDEDRLDLFRQMYMVIHDLLPQAIIRGREEEIVGVSNPDEKYIFYISQDEDGYVVKFKNQKPKPFLPEEKNTLLCEAKENALLTISNPELFHLQGKQYERKKREERPQSESVQKDHKASKTASVVNEEASDDRELYLRFNVNPEDYQNISICMPLFPMRLFHSLIHGGIETVEQLLLQKPSDLLRLKNFGHGSMNQVEEVLLTIIAKQNSIDEPAEKENYELPEKEKDEGKKEDNYLSPKVVINNLRKDTGNRILSYAGTVQSSDVLDRQCEEFVLQFKKALLPLLFEIPPVRSRNKAIFSKWLSEKKTLAELGTEYDLSRERIRQICLKQLKILLSRIKYYPTAQTAENMSFLSDVLTGQDPEMIFVYLKYMNTKYHSLLQLIVSLFFYSITDKERELFNTCILNAPNSILKPRQSKPEKKSYTPPIPTGKICPRCGAQLVIYTARRGVNPGQQFVGCSQFPKCRYSAEIVYVDRSTNTIVE